MRVLVLGGASCVWRDVVRSEARLGERWWDAVVAANDVGAWWPTELDHWVTLHPEKLPRWETLRAVHGLPNGYVRWAKGGMNADRDTMPEWPSASSGGLAVQVARERLDADRVVVAGVPMTASGFFGASDEQHITTGDGRWAHADKHFQKGWKRLVDEGRLDSDWCRSMSGRTRALLGAPTKEWLNGEAATV